MIVGPFTGEHGDEILTWIPYLRKRLGEQFENATAISRGGTDSWYPCKVVNAYDYVKPEEFKALLVARGNNSKPLNGRDKLDALIYERTKLITNIHPREMYQTEGFRRTKYDYELPKPVGHYPGLPEKYVAVRFYRNGWLRAKPNLEKQDYPTVGLKILNSPDNHQEVIFPCDIMVEYDAKRSFDVLSRVISHSERFICNYGSLVFLGALFGKDVHAYTMSVSEAWHRSHEARLCEATGGSITRFELRNGKWGPREDSHRWI